MKKIFIMLCALIIIAITCSGIEIPAGTVKISGKVTVTKRQSYKGPGKGFRGNISWRTVSAATFRLKSREVYHIVMDEKGADFARTMNRMRVEIYGIVSEKEGKKWIKVIKYADHRMEAAHELWRRMRCNACIIGPAVANARQPNNLQGILPVSGRYFPFRSSFIDFSKDKYYLWLATDNRIFRINCASKKLANTYDRTNGLPETAVYHIHSDGKTVWIAHRKGIAALGIESGTITDISTLRCSYARIITMEEKTVIIADTGTYILGSPEDTPIQKAAFPAGKRIRKKILDGLWLPHWKRSTGHFIQDPVVAGGKLYIMSYGSVYEFDGTEWKTIAGQGWELREADGKLWFAVANGITEYDPVSGEQHLHTPPDISEGRIVSFIMTDKAAWISVVPIEGQKGEADPAGGIGRFDRAKKSWTVWKNINGKSALHTDVLKSADSDIWAVSRQGSYRTKAAHPGMTYVKRKTFVASGFSVHVYNENRGTWSTLPLSMPDLEKRLICGQDGAGRMDMIVPQLIEDISITSKRMFSVTRLLPKKYFSGYWPSINQIALRTEQDKPWNVTFEHKPDSLCLQGEHPDVLNISNKGEMILEAVGHDNILGLFTEGEDHWAVTEGCAAYFDESAGKWKKEIELNFRFYWRATAALEDGAYLYIGSDRGVISRLNFTNGRFEILGALKDRSVSHITKNESGNILFNSIPATMGMLPVHLRNVLKPLETEAAEYNGKALSPVAQEKVPAPPDTKPAWFIKRIEKKRHRKDRSTGNFLWGPSEDGAKPRYYIKEVFWPSFLCTDASQKRIWISAFMGICRIEQPEETQ